MTLSTDIRVMQKTDPSALHAWINKNLLKAPEAHFDYSSVDEDKWNGTVLLENEYPADGEEVIPRGRLLNHAGQGFAAWLIMDWEEDGIPTDREENPEDFEEDSTWGLDEPKGSYLNINFDTAYGYRDKGMGCTELHASFIIELAQKYFEPRGLDFYWKDEYSGKWYHGLDSAGFTEFLGGGDDAMNWFNDIVVPVISAEVAAEGGTIEWEK